VNWAIMEECKNICGAINRAGYLKSGVSLTYYGLRSQIIHFGSEHAFMGISRGRKPGKAKGIVLTIFHLVPKDGRISIDPRLIETIDIFHTACHKTRNELISLGVPAERIVVIPLGIDLSVFSVSKGNEKKLIRQELGIPERSIVIGSFQKDGVGWGEGLEPKLIKGPDVFVSAVKQLALRHPVFVLLAGPARGYVKDQLQRSNIPYKHVGYLGGLAEVARYYKALDLYLITSRIEGGPKALLESWASGIPVVSTRVGMVPDISHDGTDILQTEQDNSDETATKAGKLIEDDALRANIVRNGSKEVKKYEINQIAKAYYEKIYSVIMGLRN
jgi:glycosyltransferase involved in cell wall biosynthesis